MGTSNNTYYSDFGQQKRVMKDEFDVIFPQMNISLAMFSVGAWNGQVNGHQAPKKWGILRDILQASQVPIQLSGDGAAKVGAFHPPRLVGKLGWGRCDPFW